jgi:predicted DCC family thiol-disulfide oxidoreductase YuxK
MAVQSIILFDGVCNLCNAAVQFVIKRDKKNQFLFASLQSETGSNFLKDYGLDSAVMNSFVLIENGKAYQRSKAALLVLKKLSGLWALFYGFIIVPTFIRDGVYNFISRKRYKWFGRQDECMLPTPELKAKFLNQ